MAMFGMTDEKKSLLIQEIYCRPLIWKVTDEKYTDVPARWLAFEEIAKELTDDHLTFTSDMIKVAWKNMMDYYNQIRRRHDRAAAAGMPLSESKWQFYHMMHFTKQDKPPVKRKYNWMEPAKIPRRPNETFVNEEYKLFPNGFMSEPAAELAKPIPVWPLSAFHTNNIHEAVTSALQNSVNALQMRSDASSNQNVPNIPRTKESEKARIQAKRAALRDTNAVGTPVGRRTRRTRSKHVSPGKAKGRDSPAKSILSPRNDEDDASSASASQGMRLTRRSSQLRGSNAQQSKRPSPERKRGRPRKRPPSGSPPPSSPSPKRRKAKSPQKRLSAPPTLSAALPNVDVPVDDRPASACDVTSEFARTVAARLYTIRSRSSAEYFRSCLGIDITLRDIESHLGITPKANSPVSSITKGDDDKLENSK